MKEKYNLFKRVLNEPESKTITVSEIEKMLDDEISKKDNDMDLELIEELSLTLIELKGKDIINVNPEEKLYKLLNRINNQKCKKHHIPRWATGLAAACLILVCGNIYSVSAYNKNIFSLVVDINKEDFVVRFNRNTPSSKQEIILPTSEDDPYGIIAECAKYNIYPDTPTYIPEGFKLVTITTDIGEVWSTIMFHYEKDDMFITLSYDYYYDSKDIMDMSIPSDHFNIQEIDINGVKGITSYEDDQYTLTYCKNNIVYLITLFYLDSFEEVQKVIDSLTPQNSINCTEN